MTIKPEQRDWLGYGCALLRRVPTPLLWCKCAMKINKNELLVIAVTLCYTLCHKYFGYQSKLAYNYIDNE